MSIYKMSLPIVAASLLIPAFAAAEEAPDEIIVTASPLKGDKIAVPVTQLDQTQLDAKGAASIGDMLGDQPGITQSGFAAGASRPIIRGLDNFRVRVQENGVAAQGVSALSEDHGAPIDPLAAEKIEVLRGPATLRFGTQAIGGVVTVLNNRIPDRLPANGVEGEVYGALSSVNHGREAAMHVDAGTGNIALHADGFVRRAGDYDIPAAPGTVQDTFTRMEGYSIGASHIGDEGYIGFSGGRFESEYGIPAAEQRLFIDMRQTRFNVAGDLLGVSFEGGWSDYTHDEVARATGAIGSTFKNKEWEGRAEYLHEGVIGDNGAVGIQLSGRDLSASGEGGELLAPAQSQTWAGFAFEELALNPVLTLQLAARLEQVRHEGFGVTPPQLDGATLGQEIDDFGMARTRDFTLVSGSAGLVKELGEGKSINASLQYAQRAPAVPELFSKGAHEATETFEIGNPGLKEEHALSAELGVSGTDFSVTAFYTHFNDFIFKDFTGFVCGEEFDTCGMEGDAGVEDELTQIAFRQTDAHFYGVEAEGTLPLVEAHGFQIGAEGRFDLVRAELDGGQNVPRIPPMRLGAGVVAEGENLFARIFLNHVFAQKRLGQNESQTGGYNDLSAQIMWQPPALAGVALGVSGRNLLDVKARNHVSFKKDDVLLPGRNLRVFVRASF